MEDRLKVWVPKEGFCIPRVQKSLSHRSCYAPIRGALRCPRLAFARSTKTPIY